MSVLLRACNCEDLTLIRYPCYISDKEDGIRCSVMESPRTGNRLVGSKTEKPIPNIHIRDTIHNSNLPFGVDGELMLKGKATFQNITSAVMSVNGEFDFVYKLMDYYGCGRYVVWEKRWQILQQLFDHFTYPWLELIPQYKVADYSELMIRYEDALARGKEGIMIRSPDGFYKPGQSTFKQQTLVKLKPFVDSDACVSGFVELEFENNPSRRSGMMGALQCHDETRAPEGRNFEIGTGFTEDQRKEIWVNRDKYLGKILTYKYQNVGVKHKPRTPVFRRWRKDAEL